MTLVGSITNVMVVPNSSPAKSVREFIDYAKANRGKITFASGGVGTTPHLSGELLKRMARIEMVHVPYNGGAPAAFNDLVGGRVDAVFGNLPALLPLIQTGALRALAPVTVGVAAPGRLLDDVSFINASGLVRRGAIRRVGRAPLAFYERPEWIRAWFPDHAAEVIACCAELARRLRD